MAITCTPTIRPVNVAEKKVRVECLIAVDDAPDQIVIVEEADISTPQNKAEIANTIWKKFLVKHQQQANLDGIASELEALEAALKTNIEGRVI